MTDRDKTKAQLLEEINSLRVESDKLHKLTKDHQHEKEELRKNNRALKILSSCNQALIRAKEERTLLNNICRIIIDKGGYKFAWIGYLQDDENKSVLPAAYAGSSSGYLNSLSISCTNNNYNKNPVSHAIHERKTKVAADIPSEKNYTGWKEVAAQKGFLSSISFPLLKDDYCFGVLSIYSSYSNAFDYTEITLLRELSDDLAFGISSLRLLKEKEKIDKNLSESEDRTRSLFENAAIGIYRTTTEGRLVMANPELIKILGYDSYEDLRSAEMKDIYTEIEKREEFLETAYRNGIVTGFETELRRKDGLTINVRLNGRLINNYSFNERYLEGTLEDITSKKEIERNLIEAKERAEEMNRLKDNFLANMSHELRTPMVGILGFSEIFLNNMKDDEYKEMAEALYSSGKRLMETLDSILDLSKLEANQIQLCKTKVNINNQVNELISSYSETAQKKGLYIKHEISDEDIYSVLDIQILKKILNNLVNNAIKYTARGGVVINVNSQFIDGRKWAVIKITDTGIGIPEQGQKIIFEDFRQLSEGLNRKYEGNGLGLSLTKRFVELMGGVLHLESTINSGSIFTIKFPSADSSHGTLSETNKDQPVRQSSAGGLNTLNVLPYVLMVDNDLTTIDIAKIMLKNVCYVDYALNGGEALEKITKKNYDAVFMDINLGTGLNGMEVTKKIKENPAYAGIPVIACTAYAMQGDKEKFLQEGCTHYVSKPFQKETIVCLLKGIFNR